MVDVSAVCYLHDAATAVCNLAETITCIMYVITVLVARCAFWQKCSLHDACCGVARCLYSPYYGGAVHLHGICWSSICYLHDAYYRGNATWMLLVTVTTCFLYDACCDDACCLHSSYLSGGFHLHSTC